MSLQKNSGPHAEDPAATRSTLIHRLQDWGDHGSWQEFFDTYWKLIYSVALKAGLPDVEAQDVVQETVIAVAKQVRTGGYDRRKGSFKQWLCLITRRRIIDRLRERTDPKLRHHSKHSDPARTDTVARIADPASLDLNSVWEEEWEKNLMEAAIGLVRQQVSPKHFQIFDLSALRNLPVSEVARLLKVSVAQVYLVRHRIKGLVKKAVKRIEARGERIEYQNG